MAHYKMAHYKMAYYKMAHYKMAYYKMAHYKMARYKMAYSGPQKCCILTKMTRLYRKKDLLWSFSSIIYTLFCLFVCVEVLRPSQPNGVVSSTVCLPNHMFTGQA